MSTKKISDREPEAGKNQDGLQRTSRLRAVRAFCRVPCILRIDDPGMRAIEAGGDLLMPTAGGILELDGLGRAGKLMMARRDLGCGQGIVMGGEGLGEDVVDLVGPAPIVFHNFISYRRHGDPL